MGVLSRLAGALRGIGKRAQQATKDFFGVSSPAMWREEAAEEKALRGKHARKEEQPLRAQGQTAYDKAQTNLAKEYLKQKTSDGKRVVTRRDTTQKDGGIKTSVQETRAGNSFYAATKELWVHDVPTITNEYGVTTIDTTKIDEIIMKKLGVTNMYDAISKLEEMMGINPFTDDSVFKDFDRYDAVMAKGQKAIMQMKEAQKLARAKHAKR